MSGDGDLPRKDDGRGRPAFSIDETRPAGPVETRSWPAAADGADEEVGLDEIWAVLRRRWAWIAGAVLVTVTAAAWWTWWQAPVWEASTTVRVEASGRELSGTEQALLLSRGASELETEMRVLETRPIRERVVDALDLHVRLVEPADLSRDRFLRSISTGPSVPRARYRMERVSGGEWRLTPTFDDSVGEAWTAAPGDTVEVDGASFVVAPDAALRSEDIEPPAAAVVETAPASEAVAALGRSLSVTRPDPDARLIQVRYRSTDRILAREVTNTLTQAFIDRRQQVQSSEARSRVGFLEEQTARIEAQLEAAEHELQRFREQEQVVAPEAEAEAQVKQRAELQARRAELASERAALSELVEELESAGPGRVERLATFPTFMENETVQTLFESLVTARQEKRVMLERRTEKHPDVVALTERIEGLETQLAAVGRNYLRSLTSRIAALDARLARFGTELEEVPGREVQFARLERRTELLSELHTTLQKQLKAAEVRAAVEDPSIRVVESAVLPDAPVSPNPIRNLAFAGFLGLMLGVGLAFVREYTDRRIRSDEDLGRLLDAAVLGRVPDVPEADGRRPRRHALVTHRNGRAVAAESYRTIRTNIRYARRGEGARELVVTSPGPRDGKSMTASNLAVAFAQQGRRTLLIDADLRKGVLHEVFELDREPGLSGWLVGDAELADTVRLTEVKHLSVLPTGVRPPNPAELLDSDRMDRLLERAREEFDAIVVDTPPVLAVTDASVLGVKAEGVLVVVRADRTERMAAAEALDQLRRLGCEVLGVVLNDAAADGRYGYHYQEYYRHDEGDDERGRLRRLLPLG